MKTSRPVRAIGYRKLLQRPGNALRGVSGFTDLGCAEIEYGGANAVVEGSFPAATMKATIG